MSMSVALTTAKAQLWGHNLAYLLSFFHQPPCQDNEFQICSAVPKRMDRKKGREKSFSNSKWEAVD